jgi:hypothetical protein
LPEIQPVAEGEKVSVGPFQHPVKPALPEIRARLLGVPKLLSDSAAVYGPQKEWPWAVVTARRATLPQDFGGWIILEDVRRSFAANALLVLILFVVPIIAVFVVPLVLRWAHLVPPAAK